MAIWSSKKTNARRQEIRRSKAERGLTWRSWIPSRVPALPMIIALTIGLVVAVLVTTGPDPLRYRLGERTMRPVDARLDFRVFNEDRTRLMRQRAFESTDSIYSLDASLLDDIRGRLTNAMKSLADVQTDGAKPSAATAESFGVTLSEDALTAVRELVAQESFTSEAWVEAAVQNLRRTAIVETGEVISPRTSLYSVLRDPQNELGRRDPVSQLVGADSAEKVRNALTTVVQPFPEPLRPAIADALLAMMTTEDGKVRPLYRYQAQASLEAAQAEEAKVEEQYDEYPAGTTLADMGTISQPELAVLQAEHNAFQRSDVAVGARLSQLIGRAALALALVVGFTFYLLEQRSSLKTKTRNDWVRLLVLLAAILASRLVYINTGIAAYTVAAQVVAVGLIAVLGPRGVLTPIAAVLAILITLATSLELNHFMLLVFVSGAMLIGLKEVRNRGKIVIVGLLAAVVAFLFSYVTGLLDGQSARFVLKTMALPAAVATLGAAFIVEGILPGFERLLRISTSMTLLEWCDANKPLMRMMAGEAPGTYNHSLLVGSLAEAAAEAIGANGLMCRAGAYYHDIGKTRKPEYFVENQQLGISPHEKLTPAMSHLIIVNHVKHGIEMAKEYNVPEVLHQFIAEHHGTTIVEYFFHQASKARKADEPEVVDTSFRYPGPKPQSRETAILMICDAVEGAVRAMPEPTPARIEEVVTTITQKRLIDGQFDECELTFRDLANVERALVKALNGIYHARIAYPQSDKKDAKGDAKAKISDTEKVELSADRDDRKKTPPKPDEKKQTPVSTAATADSP